MTVTSSVLGVLLGLFTAFAQYDSPWWPYILTPPAELKSKVPLSLRAASISFYKSKSQALFTTQLPLILSALAIAISIFYIYSNKELRRLHIIVVSLLTGSISSYFFITLPFVTKLSAKRVSSAQEVEALRGIALGHLVSAALVAVSLLFVLVATLKENEFDLKKNDKLEKDAKKVE